MSSLLRPTWAAAQPAICRYRLSLCRFSISAQATSSDSSNPSSSASASYEASNEAADIAELLAQPSWSVASLLSESKKASQEPSEVTADQLRHLFRLSALPFPTDPKEQAAKIDTLRTQLHFVRHVQSVQTNGLKPLQAIRDETKEGMKQYTVGIKDVEHTLLQEEYHGHNRRPRRRKGRADAGDVEGWDALATATRKAGRYIVVNGTEQ